MTRTGTSGKSGGRRAYAPLARTLDEDRYLLNWLSTRVGEDSRQVCNLTAYAHALGLTVKRDAYTAPGEMKHTPSQLRYTDFLRRQRQHARKAG